MAKQKMKPLGWLAIAERVLGVGDIHVDAHPNAVTELVSRATMNSEIARKIMAQRYGVITITWSIPEDYYGASYKDIGKCLGISVKKVKEIEDKVFESLSRELYYIQFVKSLGDRFTLIRLIDTLHRELVILRQVNNKK